MGIDQESGFRYKCTYHTQVKNSPEPEHQDAGPESLFQQLCSCSGRTRENVPARQPRPGPHTSTRTRIRPEPRATPGHIPSRALRPHRHWPLHGRDVNGNVFKERMTLAWEGRGSCHLRPALPSSSRSQRVQGQYGLQPRHPGHPATRVSFGSFLAVPWGWLACPRAVGKAGSGGTCVPCVPALAEEEGAVRLPWPWLFKVQEWTDAGTRGGI